MASFLGEIAKVYVEREKDNISDYCFIFPNRRSGTFFRKYLTDYSSTAMMLPQILTISEFMSTVSDLVEADRMEQLFVLYEEYRKICVANNVEVSDFDKFIYWGYVLINDFNDVDKYLANPSEVFANVKELREINTDYLSNEQKEVLRKFGFKVSNDDANFDKFWKNCSTAEQKFISLWEILYQLYKNLADVLRSEGKSLSGHLYRTALQKLKDTDRERLRYKRYIFVGFSMLSNAESEIFKTLKKHGVADFYWDLYSPYFTKENKASKFVTQYKKDFPSKYDLDIPSNEYPQINVISVPSNSGQVQCISQLINDMVKRGDIKSTDNAINTAIILPDESLFLPALSKIPKSIGTVNITMGLSIRYSSIFMLMSSLSMLHKRATKIKDEFTYFYEDVKSVLLNPLIKRSYPDEVKYFLKSIVENRMFRIRLSDFDDKLSGLKEVFTAIPDLNNREAILDYFHNIISSIEKLLEDGDSVEYSFVEQYRMSFEQIKEVLHSRNIELKGETFFYLLERTLSTVTINLEGMPLSGLQIMGVLETRNLDFDNVIVLSVNERVFPKKQFSKSFIPNNIRGAYGLSTSEHQESIYAYYFYRLISKAKNVYLLYDSRTEAIGSGEPSRYIYQLKYLYNIDTYKALSYNIVAPKDVVIEVPKTDSVMSKLNLYRTEGGGKSLSASAIKKYVNCSLSFYFEKIEGIFFEDEASEFIDSATFGTIIHGIMNEIYPKSVVINADYISNLKKTHQSDKLITKYINKEYLKKHKTKYFEELSGECLLIADVVKYYIDAILNYDKSYGDFKIIKAEEKESRYWKELGINFTQYIDRLDEIVVDNSKLSRIIDYKTGSDSLEVKSIDHLFDKLSTDFKFRAILQLFLYCSFHSYCENSDEPIKPIIYKIREINKNKEFGIKVEEKIVDDYRVYKRDFMNNMKKIIDEMFNPEVPFKQNPNPNACTYCNYKTICQR